MEYTVTYVEQLVEKYKRMGDKLIGKITPRIKVNHSHRKSRIGGLAYYEEWKILLNVPLLQIHPWEIEPTVGHEVAHLYARKIRDDCKPHGKEWKSVMWYFGLEPEVKHHMNTALVRKGGGHVRFIYTMKCKDCGVICTHSSHKELDEQEQTSYYHERCANRGRPNKGELYVTDVKTRKEFLDHLKQKAVAKAAAQVEATSVGSNSESSKKMRAEQIYLANKHQLRSVIIHKFIIELNMTKAGAATYYANCKRTLG